MSTRWTTFTAVVLRGKRRVLIRPYVMGVGQTNLVPLQADVSHTEFSGSRALLPTRMNKIAVMKAARSGEATQTITIAQTGRVMDNCFVFALQSR
jgi:hypothetical protein